GAGRAFILPREAGEGDRAEGAVEGATASTLLRRHANDGVSRFIQVRRQFGCCDSHDLHALLQEPSVAAFVSFRMAAHVVAQPVDLDGEFRLRAIKVEDVGADWMLAAKNRLSRYALAQSAPQSHFRHGQRATEAARLFDRFAWGSHGRRG